MVFVQAVEPENSVEMNRSQAELAGSLIGFAATAAHHVKRYALGELLMNEAERFEIWKQQTEEIYRGIGEFVVKFEVVCFSMSLCVQAMLERSGLKNQQISQVLLAGLTAEPLRTLFGALAAETNWLSEEERDKLKSILSGFQRLTEKRNDIVHGTWLLDFGNYASHQSDFGKAIGFKYHKNKNGVATKTQAETASELNAHIDEAIELRASVDKLCGRFMFDKNGIQVAFLLPPESAAEA